MYCMRPVTRCDEGKDARRAERDRARSVSRTDADNSLERVPHGSRVAIEQAGDGRVGGRGGGGGDAP